jgi:hypothetical protein
MLPFLVSENQRLYVRIQILNHLAGCFMKHGIKPSHNCIRVGPAQILHAWLKCFVHRINRREVNLRVKGAACKINF